MTQGHKTIAIQWTGPFKLEDLAERDDGFGLYLVTGKVRYQRSAAQIHYCGITERGRGSGA